MQVGAARDAGLVCNSPPPTTPGQRREMRVAAGLYVRAAQQRMQGLEHQAEMLDSILACMGGRSADSASAGNRTGATSGNNDSEASEPEANSNLDLDINRVAAAPQEGSTGGIDAVARGSHIRWRIQGVVEMLRWRVLRRAQTLMQRLATANAASAANAVVAGAASSSMVAAAGTSAAATGTGASTASGIHSQRLRPSDVPRNFLCPITHALMREPVVIASGHTFERDAISRWINMGQRTNPVTSESTAAIIFQSAAFECCDKT